MRVNLVFIRRFVLMTLVLVASLAQAITEEMKSLVDLETRANAVALRSNEMVLLEHYEIPLRVLEHDISARAPQAYVQSLQFKKNGEDYVRWIINPEDTKWHLEVAKFLQAKGLSAARHKYFQGYKTASRSYIVVDPQSKAEFSIKVSTNNTGGHWVDKKQTWDDAKQIRMATDHIFGLTAKQADLQHAILLDEPIAFGIQDLDQGLILRSYEGLSNSGKTYVPGFSAMEQKYGAQIASLNGSKVPGEFWNQNYNQPLARALAEFFVLSGMTFDSPHSQNFLVELDAEKRPTGKIVLRDFGDTYLLRDFFANMNQMDIINAWEQSNVKRLSMTVAVGVLHGNQAPDWMDMETDTYPTKDYKQGLPNSYGKWGEDFYRVFENEVYRQTGVRFPTMRMAVSGRYVFKQLQFDHEAGKSFLDLVKDRRVRNFNGACEKVFMGSH